MILLIISSMLYLITIIFMADNNLLTVTSYNCKSFGEDKYKIIRGLVNDSTFVLLQEHWQYEKQFIENVKGNLQNVECVVSSPMDENVQRVGRGKGGVAILWKNNFNGRIKKIQCISKRLCAVEVIKGDFKFIIFNVYMPTDPGYGNYDISDYIEVLNEITIILLNANIQISILGGDWNSDISRDNIQSKTFLSFIREQSLSLCLNSSYADVPYTFNKDNSYSIVDHFIVTNNLFTSITKYKSLFLVDDFSDHVPLKLELNINVNNYDEVPREHISSTAWYKCSYDQKQEFVNTLDNLLLQINIQHEAIVCNVVNCTRHNDFIKTMYHDIIKYCISADGVLPKTNPNFEKNNTRAGWNEYVSDNRKNALFWHQYWLDQGRPSQGQIALIRRRTRAKYHYAVRYVNREKNMIRSNRMAEAIANNKDRDLWQEVKQLKQTNKSVPNIMDNVSGCNNIISLFTEKFKDLYNSVGFDTYELESLLSNINILIEEKHTNLKFDSNY